MLLLKKESQTSVSFLEFHKLSYVLFRLRLRKNEARSPIKISAEPSST